MTNGNGKSNYSKADTKLIDRLAKFGININPILKEDEENNSTWDPLEGNYEISTLSGKNTVYSDNLSSSLFSRMKMTELYVCGSGGTAQYDGLFSYESNFTNQIESFTASDYIASTSVKTKAFDIDGDAHEDILIASFDRANNTITLYVRLYNAKKDAFSAEKTLWTTSNEHVAGTPGSTGDQGFDCFDFTIGDFDGDKQKELALSISYSVNRYGKADVYILDDYKAKCVLLASYSETETFSKIKKNDSSKVFKFASTDLNGDGRDEIYAAIGANCDGALGYYKVYNYDSASHSLQTLACDTLDKGDKYGNLCSAIVDIGDIDGDGAMDIIFEGRQKEYKNCKVLVLSYDSAKKIYNWKASSGAKFSGQDFNGKGMPYIPMSVGDIDQDGIEEIVMHNVALRYNSKSTDVDQIESIVTSSERLPCEAGNGSIAIGDFNYDGKNEVAQINWEGSELYFSSYDASSKSFKSSSAYSIERANANNNGPVSICATATKKGVARFAFKQHLLQFTEPDVIALVAAPLYFSEDNNDGIAVDEFQPYFGNQVTSIASSTSTSKEVEISYSTHEKDMVIVKVTPQNKAKDAPSVKSLFTHKAGNPYSYDDYDTTLAKIKSAKTIECSNPDSNKVTKGDYFLTSKDKMQSVPQGATETSISISKDKEKFDGNGYEISAGIEVEVEVEFVYASYGLSFGGGDTWKTTVGTGSSIEGSVVGIASEYADRYSFQWGLASYPVAIDGQYLVPMVTYYVEK